jgi:ATP-dependent DNA helicase DinG
VKEVRTEQVRMATDIEELLASEERTLLAEGGTGLGKSYAYIVPALAQIIERTQGKNAPEKNEPPIRVVIATAKKSLQAQLYSDMPRLCESLGLPNIRTVMYKGMNNYACWKLSASVPEHERITFNNFINFAKDSDSPADVAKWPGNKPVWWDMVSIDNCPLGVGCEHYRHCRPHVKDSDIIITNQHLLGLDLTLFQPGWLFGGYTFLIVDEAHQFPKALQDLLSSTLKPESVAKAARHLRSDPRLQEIVLEIGGSKSSAAILSDGIDQAYDGLMSLVRLTAGSSDSSHRYKAAEFKSQFENSHTQLDHALTSLIPIHDELVKTYSITKTLSADSDEHDSGYYLAMLNRFSKVIKPVSAARTFIEKHMNAETVKKYITIAKSDIGEESLHLTPINIGPIVGPVMRQITHKVFVSATLSLNGDFTYFKEDLGLEEATGKVYNSPFDIQNRVALYLPPWDMPMPALANSPERGAWIQAISNEIKKLCGMTRGGTFVLFSAEKDMTEVAACVDPDLHMAGIELIVQRGEVTQHVNRFKKTPNGVLFGLKSIWEGIDIVGDQLRCVIIPKLPFPHPNDPVIASRSELMASSGENAFARVSLPSMFTDMRQGVGRLIRSANDRGIIAILDVRVWTGGSKDHDKRLNRVKADPNHKRLGYGKELLDILGFTTLTNEFTRLERWYRKTFTTLNIVNPVNESEDENGETEGE